jgi:hypothetical protein
MLPGKSSRKIDFKKKKSVCNDGVSLFQSLQYNLDKLNDAGVYEFSSASDNSDSDSDSDNDTRGSSSSSSDSCEIYPFASALKMDIDEVEIDADSSPASASGEEVKINICIYQINMTCEIPFIEYLLENKYNEDLKKQQFEFPSIDYIPSKRTVLNQAKQYVNSILDKEDVVKYRGYLKKRNHYYLFFHKYFRKLNFPTKMSMVDTLWWTVVSEIVNFKKVLYLDVDKSVTSFFIKYPGIMRLYDCKMRVLETPVICYYGDQYQKITYLAFFGLLKAPLKSSFGPFYVGTNFLSSMKYACYTHDSKPFELYDGTALTNGKYGKYVEGGVLRSVLFVGKMNVFLKSGIPDNSQISQEVAKTDEVVRKLLPLRDSNGNWTVNYDTAYSGLYFINVGGGDGGDGGDNVKNNVAVNTVEWFFKDYNHSSILSYHMVETETIPDKYDVDFVDYHIK